MGKTAGLIKAKFGRPWFRNIIMSRKIPQKPKSLKGGEFIDENGGGPGVRLRKRYQKKS
jgi:hypothetical protein